MKFSDSLIPKVSTILYIKYWVICTIDLTIEWIMT